MQPLRAFMRIVYCTRTLVDLERSTVLVFSQLLAYIILNPLPHNKIWDPSKLKAFADDSFNVAQTEQFFFDQVENIVGKRENAGYQPFLFFLQFVLKGFFPRGVKRRHCVVKGYLLNYNQSFILMPNVAPDVCKVILKTTDTIDSAFMMTL